MERHVPPQSPADSVILPTREGYDRWAEIYDAEDNPLVALEEPRVAELLGEVRGLRIADIGCGTGRHAIPLAINGARVAAVDFSDNMLAKAASKPGAERVRFLRHDLSARLPFEAGSVDRVICCLVLDHIRDLAAFFAELRRICRPEGFVVLSTMHPAMMLLGVQARFTDPDTGRRVHPESVPNQISDYVMAATGAGLVFDHMSEHAVGREQAAASPRAAKYEGWPLLLLMRLRPQG